VSAAAYCDVDQDQGEPGQPARSKSTEAALIPASGTGPRADCELCGDPTEYPASHSGTALCAVCAWQQAQRIACSG
jgi:hypothetical protein